jgi:non-ribosomal peptide synthetase component E (peptide arylation enzyme)
VALRQDRRGRSAAEIGPELLTALSTHFAKWQLPDAVMVLPTLPKGNTGKIDKMALRDRATKL